MSKFCAFVLVQIQVKGENTMDGENNFKTEEPYLSVFEKIDLKQLEEKFESWKSNKKIWINNNQEHYTSEILLVCKLTILPTDISHKFRLLFLGSFLLIFNFYFPIRRSRDSKSSSAVFNLSVLKSGQSVSVK